MFGFGFTSKKEIKNQQDVASGDEALFKQFYHGMLRQGVYFAPSMYEAGFVSAAHTEEIIMATHTAAEAVMSQMVACYS